MKSSKARKSGSVTLLVSVSALMGFAAATPPETERQPRGLLDRVSELEQDVAPVGTIVGHVADETLLKSLPKWRVCDGSVLQGKMYSKSPFYGKELPKLDGVFLRATLDATALLKPGGCDTAKHSHVMSHSHAMPHVHSGKTNLGVPVNAPKADHHHEGGNHYHDFTTEQPSEASTRDPSPERTGDDETKVVPRFIGVRYIVKVLP